MTHRGVGALLGKLSVSVPRYTLKGLHHLLAPPPSYLELFASFTFETKLLKY